MKKAILILAPLVLILTFFIVLKIGNLPVSSDPKAKDFIINKGEGLISIATRLQANGFIKNKYIFIYDAYISGLKNQIPSGKFRLSQNIPTYDIVKKLSQGGSSDYWVRIIEGTRVEEITPRFSKTYEGYLFPDSYLIPEYYNPDEILKVISDNFDKKFAQAKKDSTTSLSDKQVVILASLLEREARTLETKKMIAGIMMNRFDIGMGLQIDATIQYLRDSLKPQKDYWTPIKSSDIDIVSPYNTYKNRGLPPGPICNPGYDSLYAAFHPTDSDYMYYITDNNGVMHYAKSHADHDANVTKYLKSQ